MQIRPALTADLDKFYELFSELMNEGYAGYSSQLKQRFLQKDYSINNFYLWLDKFYRLILLASEGDETVGFLVGDYTFGGVGFVSWLGVKSDKRGTGIGKSLFLEYEKFAINKGSHLIELYTYPKVQPFYEKLGFEKIGERAQGYYGQKNIIMDKKIGEWSDQNLERMS